MTTKTIVTMVVVMAFVWGGFALALVTAIRKEAGKREEGSRLRWCGGEQWVRHPESIDGQHPQQSDDDQVVEGR